MPKPKTQSKRRKALKTNVDLAVRHTGIIVQQSLKYYKLLSSYVRSYYDLEDMIQEVTLHVIRMSSRHNGERGRESTFVWYCAENKCKTILEQYSYKKRAAYDTVCFSEVFSAARREGSRIAFEDTLRNEFPYDVHKNAFDAVERVIQFGSDALLEFLEQIFAGTVGRKHYPTAVLEELKTLADKYSATLDDFMQVYRYVNV